MVYNTPIKRDSLTNNTTIENEPLLSCDICLTDVPISEAGCMESEEYVAFYFGLECYEQWLRQKEKQGD